MTTPYERDNIDLTVTYQGSVPTFGGFDAADFILQRPHQPAIECNLGLAQDARALLESHIGKLDDSGIQTLLRVIAARYYLATITRGENVQAITLLRANNIQSDEIEEIVRDTSKSVKDKG